MRIKQKMGNNLLKCKKCGKYGDFNEIKLYSLKGENETKFLCKECYNKLQKTSSKCPFCNRSIPYKATRCPYCGITFSEKTESEEKIVCHLCGAEVKHNANYCPICGTYVNGYSDKSKKNEKSKDKKLSMKIVAAIAVLIVAVSAIVGIQAYSSTVDESENIFTAYNPNARFDLLSAEFIDNFGDISMKLEFKTNSKVEVQILNEYRKTIKTVTIDETDYIALIDLDETPGVLDGGAFTIYVKSGHKNIYEETVYFIGPSLQINELNAEWTFSHRDYKDSLDRLTVNIINTGDMPAYLDHLEILIDKIHGPYTTYVPENIEEKIIIPGETIVLDLIVNISDIYPIESHTMSIDIKDHENNSLTNPD